MTPYWEKPCAAEGLTSYRAHGIFGWIMIGAIDDMGAWCEACRSTDDPQSLEVWNGQRYVAIEP
jgi:hypothetical protein